MGNLQTLQGLRREGIGTFKARTTVGWQPTYRGYRGLRREGIGTLRAKKVLRREGMDTGQKKHNSMQL